MLLFASGLAGETPIQAEARGIVFRNCERDA
jgi:hypothetical protein